jgi:RNA polymerase sigma factor (sigma-70 family)
VRRQHQLALAEAFRTLTKRERLVIYLRFFDQASHKEVAQRLGAPEIVARVLLHRTLRKLKRHLQKDGVSEPGVIA